MIWFGQSQAESWLTENGWIPPVRHQRWQEMGRELAQRDNGGQLR